jgi:hypothetical protein
MKLHKLTNGNWIDISTVTAIVKLERTQCWPGGPIHPARVVLHAGQAVEVLPCDDEQQAAEIADELAVLVNGHSGEVSDAGPLTSELKPKREPGIR